MPKISLQKQWEDVTYTLLSALEGALPILDRLQEKYDVLSDKAKYGGE